jgi:hypothetical protein
MMCGVGALVTLEVPADSPLLANPWIIRFGPLNDDEEWEPVVCGPYEHSHAMALAESIAADEELMAVVEPVQPYVSVDQIRGDIAAARLAAAGDAVEPDYPDEEYPPMGDSFPDGDTFPEPSPPPSPDEIRAGSARIAARLTGLQA